MPKCTINGKEVEFKEGSTIIEAMYQNGEEIAHFCWHPGLSVAGVCRLCMVEIQGNPRLQIACNTQASEGMVINNSCEKVKEAVKWGLDLHLINHPLDCPVCDQAGECGLQDQYMKFGKYNSEMSEQKAKKHKVVSLGERVVLDSERCVLCSRCVRFTKEVSQSNELGLFNRGDRTEIGTFENKPLNNKYSLNVVDICPVGALTSKDFRFRQRVWFLKEANTICTGCSTGCNTKVYFNKEGFFRVKPRHNEEINGYWMCDEGRDIYKFLNKPARLLTGKKRSATGWENYSAGSLAKEAASLLQQGSIAVVLTGQQSNEEYEALIGQLKAKYNTQNFYHWINNPEALDQFDGLLIRGDKNPNTKGLKQAFEKQGVKTQWTELVEKLNSQQVKTLIVIAPENPAVFPDLNEKIKLFSKASNLIWCGSTTEEKVDALTGNVWQIPLKTYVEKEGTYTNFAGIHQKVDKCTTVVAEALTLTELAPLACGNEYRLSYSHDYMVESHREPTKVMLETRKKNEFTFKRGLL